MATTFIGLYDKDATKTIVSNAATAWNWSLPTNINSRKSPTCKLSVASCYLDDSYSTATNGQNCSAPRMLRINIFSENYLQNEKSTTIIGNPIMSMMVRDAFVGHWYAPQAAHQIDLDFSTNIRQITFDFVDENGSVLPTLSGATTAGKMNMILKLTYPEHNEIRNEVVMSYAQSQVGNPRI